MKKILFLTILTLFTISLVWGQGFENFANFNITGTSYQDGTFLGQDGSTWTFVQCRGDYDITGNAIMIGRNRTPQSNFYSGTIYGGVGEISFDYMQAFGTNVNLNVLVNDIVVGNVTSTSQQGVVLSSPVFPVNQSGEIVIKFINVNNGDGQVVVDNVLWTGFGDGPIPPSISNIVQNPSTDIFSDTAVSVSAQVSPNDAAIGLVELHWGYESGNYINTITMSQTLGNNYSSVTPIPAQDDGTTVYYVVYAEDINELSAQSPVQSYLVNDPATTLLPFEETFDTNLGDCYVYSVSGPTKFWIHGSYGGNGYALMNGYNSGDIEEDWLILPSINMADYQDVIMSFQTAYNFGNDDDNNYLKLLYSVDYEGFGDPNAANWTEIPFSQPTSGGYTWTDSGEIELPLLAGTVWLGFEYRYESGNYRAWQVDNISIMEATTPLLFVNPATLSGFTYIEGFGPSAPQSFELSGTNLEGTAVTISAPTDYEISLSESINYGNDVILPSYAGENTTIWVRLAAGSVIGNYPGEIIISGGGATNQSVNLSGSVIPVPSGLPYFENFSGFDSVDTIPADWMVSDETYNGDWGTGFSSGLRGNASVLGYQHTSTSGIFTVTLNLLNNTDGALDELYISYLGMVERAGEGRSPEWTVEVNGTLIPELFYSTESEIDEVKSVHLEGLNIPVNGSIVITWSSDRGEPSGSSKQIGISDVIVDVTEPVITFLEADPVLLSDMNYFVGYGPSDSQSFVLTGINLDGTDVAVSAPTDFEISLDDLTYMESIPLLAFDGSATDVFVRLIDGLPLNDYSGEVTISGGGAGQISVAVSGRVVDELQIPYANSFRNQADYNEALIQGFVFYGTEIVEAAGGYLRIFPDGYLETPTIDFTELDEIDIGFDATTYGGDLGQTLTVKVSVDGGITYETIEAFLLTGTYVTYTQLLDLTDVYNVPTGKIRIEMTDGGGSSRFRDFTLSTDYYSPVEGLTGNELWLGLQDLISSDHIDYSYDAARHYMHAYIDNIDDQVRCIYTGEWVNHPYGTMSTPPEFSSEHIYAQSWYEVDLDPENISFAVSDLNALFPARLDVNNARSNNPFDYVTNYDPASNIWGSGDYLSYLGSNANNHTVFDVADEFKGNIARALLYFSVRYYTDNSNLIRFNVDQLPILIQWHLEDPVDDLELSRNEKIYSYQGNRNPFIDRPEFVTLIWGEIDLDAPIATDATSITEDGFTANWESVIGAASYRLDVSESPSFVGFIDGHKNIVVNSTSHTITNLEPSTTYYYRVRAIDGEGTLSLNSNVTATLTEIQGALVHYWNFNDNVPETGENWSQPITSQIGNGEITYTFTEAISFGGTTLNGIPGEENGGSFVPRPGIDLVNNGEHFDLSVPTNGYANIIFSYATQATGSGFMTQQVLYSTNGIDFTEITTYSETAAFSWLVRSIDFSDIPEANNNPDFTIRIVLDGGTFSTGNNRFDNIRVVSAGTPVLYPPQNVTVTIDGDNVIITWNEEPGASTYRIEASENPDGTYFDATTDYGTLNGTQWISDGIPGTRMFFRVIAVE